MCRSIKTLFNYEPAVTEEDIHAASLQFIRKISGFREPSLKNAPAYEAAITEVEYSLHKLLNALETKSLPKNRLKDATKAIARRQQR